MLVPNNEEKVFETFGNIDNSQAREFQIKQSKHAFKILSSGLYSDKILAVIREYSANAWDAHRMSGKQKTPIKVHLPNTLEPYFSVTDEGPGLSHEDILELFTTFFSSSKQNTNAATGMLGLGSKSAFSYTDSFMVTSKHKGVSRVYNCYVSKDGVPSVNKISEIALSDLKESGLEVKIAVQMKDFNEFITKAQKVYKIYEPQPIISGSKIDLNPQKIMMEVTDSATGVTVKVLESPSTRSFYRTGQAFAVQGACAYPISSAALNKKYQALFQHDLLFVFPIGAINITASREQIEYDPSTIMAIENAGQIAMQMLASETSDEMKKVTTLFDACIKAQDFMRTSPIWDVINQSVFWKDPKTNTVYSLFSLSNKSFVLQLKEEYTHVVELTDRLNPTGPKVKSTQKRLRDYAVIQTATSSDLVRLGNGIRWQTPWGGAEVNLNPKSKWLIIVEDTPTIKYNPTLVYNLKGKVDLYQANHDNFMFIRPMDGYHDKVLKEVTSTLEGFKIVKFSELEEPPKKNKEERKKRTIYGVNISKYEFSDVEHDVTTGGVYVDVFRHEVKGLNGQGFSALKDLLKTSIDLGLIDLAKTPVFGFPSSYKEIPHNNKGWVLLYEVLEKEIQKKLAGVNISAEQEAERNRMVAHKNFDAHKVLKIYKGISKTLDQVCQDFEAALVKKSSNYTDLANLLTQVQEAKESSTGLASLVPQVQAAVASLKPPQPISPLEASVTLVKSRYPLLFSYGNDTYKGVQQSFVDYIRMVDKDKPVVV